MDYVIVGLLIGVVILLLVLLLRGKDNKDTREMTERIGKLETYLAKEIGDFKVDFASSLRTDFDKLNEQILNKINYLNDKVNERLEDNFQKSNRTFNNILERLSKIDEAQKKIDGLSCEIVSLQSVLTDKKTRGIFGEVNLNYILNSVFGENATGIYEVQHKLSNGYIADAILYAPSPLGTICIDSKFPLENYQKMTDKTLSKEARDAAAKQFKLDVKKHIEAIRSKYIVPGETAGEAILFLPAEAIFAELNAYHSELLEEAYNKKVWITSPTTLMSTLTTIGMVLKNMERDKYAKVIHEELNKLSFEFERYRERWDKLSRSIDTVTKDVRDINITTEKITKRFDSINRVDVKELEEKREEKELVGN